MLINTCFLTRAVSIHLTLRLWRVSYWWKIFTLDHRIAKWHILRTMTISHVLEHMTNCIRSTFIVIKTWIYTFAIEACLSCGAFRVASASYQSAFLERITFQSRWTATLGTMFFWIAFSIDPTRVIHTAGINTNRTVAHLVIRAFFILDAAT